MPLKEKIKQLIELKRITPYELAIKTGISEATFSRILAGSTKSLNNKTLNILADYFNVSRDWLKDEEDLQPIEKSEPDIVMEKSTPYYPDVNASAGMDFLTNNGHNYNIPIKSPNVDAQAYINVFGDSMYPKFCSGEIIGIKEIDRDMVFFGNAYVIQMINGEAYIKYIDPGKDDEHWMLRSENPHYKEKQFHLSKIHKIFVIKAVITKSTIL